MQKVLQTYHAKKNPDELTKLDYLAVFDALFKEEVKKRQEKFRERGLDSNVYENYQVQDSNKTQQLNQRLQE